MNSRESFCVIGAGFSGAVLARELVEALDCFVEVRDERNHIAGNCHTERDPETGVMVHKYGPHIFNTDDEKVWSYVRQFGDFRTFVNRVKALMSRGIFSLPINLMTINQFFGKSLNPAEAQPLTIYHSLAAGVPVVATDMRCLCNMLSGVSLCAALPSVGFEHSGSNRRLV